MAEKLFRKITHVELIAQRAIGEMEQEHVISRFNVRRPHINELVQTPRTSDGWVDHFRLVGRCNDENSFFRRSIEVSQDFIYFFRFVMLKSSESGTRTSSTS